MPVVARVLTVRVPSVGELVKVEQVAAMVEACSPALKDSMELVAAVVVASVLVPGWQQAVGRELALVQGIPLAQVY
jgi:hypothetical protein